MSLFSSLLSAPELVGLVSPELHGVELRAVAAVRPLLLLLLLLGGEERARAAAALALEALLAELAHVDGDAQHLR